MDRAGRNADRRAVAGVIRRLRCVFLNQHRVVNVTAERFCNGPQIGLIAVAGQLDALGETVGKMRERIDLTEKTDLVTQDIFIELTAKLEKHNWMFQAEQQDA